MTVKAKKETNVEGGISSIGGAAPLVVGHSEGVVDGRGLAGSLDTGKIGGQLQDAPAKRARKQAGGEKVRRVRGPAPKAAYHVTLVQNTPGGIPATSVRAFVKKSEFEAFLEGELVDTKGLAILSIVRGHALKVEKRTAYRLTAAQG